MDCKYRSNDNEWSDGWKVQISIEIQRVRNHLHPRMFTVWNLILLQIFGKTPRYTVLSIELINYSPGSIFIDYDGHVKLIDSFAIK